MLTRTELILLVLALAVAGAARSATAQDLADRIAASQAGDTLFVDRDQAVAATIVIDRPIVLIGRGWPVLDGQGERGLIEVRSDSVTIAGLVFRHTGVTFMDDRAALRLQAATDCLVRDNRFEDTFFGVYLAEVQRCRISGNTFVGKPDREVNGGNAIHSWNSRRLVIDDNDITGHRDGIYLEFTLDSQVYDNASVRNLRYGLHFMFSDRCVYERNRFEGNGAGVAVMYAEDVDMTANVFRRTQGSSAYGLLLKEIKGGTVSGNTFQDNSIALFVESSDRLVFERNRFEQNGWAVRVMADARDDVFRANVFVRNTFDVSTNSRSATGSRFENNYWDRYDGYDLDRDGLGDKPFHPVRLYAFLVERHEPALILLRSAFVAALDLVEAVAPVFTPASVVDPHPLMHLPAVAGDHVSY